MNSLNLFHRDSHDCCWSVSGSTGVQGRYIGLYRNSCFCRKPTMYKRDQGRWALGEPFKVSWKQHMLSRRWPESSTFYLHLWDHLYHCLSLSPLLAVEFEGVKRISGKDNLCPVIHSLRKALLMLCFMQWFEVGRGMMGSRVDEVSWREQGSKIIVLGINSIVWEQGSLCHLLLEEPRNSQGSHLVSRGLSELGIWAQESPMIQNNPHRSRVSVIWCFLYSRTCTNIPQLFLFISEDMTQHYPP